MRILFENYYNDALKFSEQLYRKLLKNPPAPSDEIAGNSLVTIVNGTPDIIVTFYKAPLSKKDDSQAYMINIHQDKRTTVVTKTGNKRRRKLVVDGSMGINVANIIQLYKHQISDYDVLKPYIKKVGKNAYAFDDRITMNIFLNIVMDLITTNIFAKIFTHEVQHFYNPFVHQRAEQIRKHETEEELTAQQQRDINYTFSNQEINSRITEAATSIIGNPAFARYFSSPKFLSRFINACIDEMRVERLWEDYPEEIKRKMIKRWTQIFHERVNKDPALD